jgi:aryl-alcohol dehydrogenase-like predicted oxidoreductase
MGQIDFDEKKVKRTTNSAEHIRSYLEASTERIGSAPDLYYLHRRDPETPLSESIATLGQLKKEGKVKYIGLSEVSAETLREACKSEFRHGRLVGTTDTISRPY